MKVYDKIMTILNFGDFVKHSTLYFIISISSGIVIMPFYIKQQGIILPLVIISAVAVIKNIADALLPYVEHWSLKRGAYIMIVMDILYTLTYLILLHSVEYFIYARVSLGVVHGVAMNMFTVNYDDYISRGEKGRFKKIQIMERTTFAVSGLIAGMLASVLYYVSTELAIGLAILLSVSADVYGVWIYNRFWSKV